MFEKNVIHPGLTWWNFISENDRLFWLRAALTAVPAEAYAYYRRVTIEGHDAKHEAKRD